MKSKFAVALLGSLLICQASAAVSTTVAAKTPVAPAGTLAQRWAGLRAEQPKLAAREAARTLGVSEAELLASGTGQGVTRLKTDGDGPREIMRRALDLGTVLATTRNEYSVIERTGVASKLKQQDETGGGAEADTERAARQRNIAGGYLGGDIDLRFHFSNWKHAFAVVQPGRDGAIARSLQFFDASGTSAHKIYLKNEAGVAVFDKLVAEFRHAEQNGALAIAAAAPKPAEQPDAAIDVKEFQLAWKDMTDVHQFNQILGEFKLSREQALRLAPAGQAERVAPLAVRKLLDDAAKQKIGIMAFVGNEAVTQIFSGTIDKTAAAGDWYNVLDPAFNLHLRESGLKSGWVVKRGGVTSVEFFDNNGELAVTFFGVRARAAPQPQAWLDLAQSLPRVN
ncbi:MULTISPECIES: hemin-degrading factor [unclassified Janthinobacterium]|uniref:hemin-degrading factor n=1 Tax=unclassified Janthinobacterium TaxID=2610881 RepID=UPI000346FD10|nr:MULTISPECIES: hemin-degrading factor [unclassified Janthinobacterium]MEC5161250.1 putative hemin transport protein [Janthinobacterium sp. CG_S6]